MGLSSFGVKSLADNLAVADEDAAHHGVGAGVPGRLPRQLDAPAHVVRVHVARLRLRLAPHAGREPPRAAAADREAGAARGGRRGCWAGGEMGARDERGGDHVPCAGEKPHSNRDVCGEALPSDCLPRTPPARRNRLAWTQWTASTRRGCSPAAENISNGPPIYPLCVPLGQGNRKMPAGPPKLTAPCPFCSKICI
jgi:hypothetical protein